MTHYFSVEAGWSEWQKISTSSQVPGFGGISC